MTLTFFTNLVHHHQIPLADEFYKILGDDYRYVATMPMPEFLVKGGYDRCIERPYIVRAYENEKEKKDALWLANSSDVVICGAAPEEWMINRKKANKITFHYNERWLKTNLIRSFGPKNLLYVWLNHFRFRTKRTFMLCASAFTASDVHKFGCYPQKCFKWGYITKVQNEFQDISTFTNNEKVISIMWCARFLDWKHPELPVLLASRLKKRGFVFKLDMYGSGKLLEATKDLAVNLDVADVVNFCGNMPNSQILAAMREHSIFLFTSDRNEGWGAVVNEAMSNGCAVVGSDEIGSVPFLVEDGVNGVVFKSRNIDSLEEKICLLLSNPKKMNLVREQALLTMQQVWNPQNAALKFLDLVDYIERDKLHEYKLKDGPASWAE